MYSTTRSSPTVWDSFLLLTGFLVFFTLPFNGMIALTRVLMAVFILPLCWQTVSRRQESTRLVPIALWLWAALPVFSWLWSVNRVETAANLMVNDLYPFLGFVACCYGSNRNKWAAIWGYIAGILIACVMFCFDVWHRGGMDQEQVRIFFHGIGMFSTHMVLVVPLLFVAFYSQKNRYTLWLLLLGIPCVLLSAYLIQSRMVWLSIMLEVMVFFGGLYTFGNAKLSKRKIGALLLMLVALLALYYLVAEHRPASVLRPNDSSGAAWKTFVENERFQMWAFWFEKFKLAPWLGIGFGYGIQKMTYLHQMPANWDDLMHAHAHNLFINYAVQLGAIGLLIFLAAICSVATLFFRSLKHPDRLLMRLGAVGLALIVGMISKNMTDDYYYGSALFAFWSMLGAMTGLLLTRQAAAPSSGQ